MVTFVKTIIIFLVAKCAVILGQLNLTIQHILYIFVARGYVSMNQECAQLAVLSYWANQVVQFGMRSKLYPLV